MDEIKKEAASEEKPVEKEFEKREKDLVSRAKTWLKNPYNAALVGILVLAFIIRIYYFNVTKDQALWWDELCYGSIAKNFLTHTWDNTQMIIGETTIRPLLMSLVWAGLIKLGFSETIIRVILEFIPSVLSVLLVYFVAAKLYNKRVALISAFVLAVSWLNVFYSMRLLVHIPGLMLSLASIYYFFKSLEKEKLSLKYFSLSVFLAFIATLTRWNYGLTGIAFIFYLCLIEGIGFYLAAALLLAGFAKIFLGLSTVLSLLLFLVPLAIGAWFNKNNLKIFNKKNFWIGGLIGSIPLLVFFTINYLNSGVFFPTIGYVASQAAQKTSFFYGTFGFFPHILQEPFLALFILGIVVMAVQLFLGFGLLSKVKKLGAHFFIFSVLILNTFFLTFYMRYAEDRYLLECFVSIVIAVAIGVDTIFVYARRYNKQLAFLLVVVLLASGAYFQYTYGGSPIIVKQASSFYQMKEAFLWIKDNTPKDSVLFGSGIQPYSIYYAERTPLKEFESAENQSLGFDYAVVHGFTQPPPGFQEFLSSIQGNLTPVNAFYLDREQKQPIVIIYKYNKPESKQKTLVDFNFSSA